MRVFMTGASGFVGGHVAAALKASGHEVVALARHAATANRLEQEGYRVERGDMARPDEWKAEAARADALVHAALLHRRLRASRLWLWQAERADRAALAGLIEAAHAGRRCTALVEASGTLVYGDQGDDWVTEDTPPKPTAMGGYHLHGEQLVRQAAKRGVPACSLRLGMIYGSSGMFAGVYLENALRGAAYVIGQGQNYQSPVHIDDVARAFLSAIDNPAVGEALNVVDDEPMRMADFAGLLLEMSGGGKVRHVPPWLVSILAGHPLAEMATTSARCRNDRTKQRLNWTPRYATAQIGLPAAIRAYRAAARPA